MIHTYTYAGHDHVCSKRTDGLWTSNVPGFGDVKARSKAKLYKRIREAHKEVSVDG